MSVICGASATIPCRIWQAAAKIINSGVLNARLKPLVSAIYPLDRSMEAFERAKSDKSVLRVLIDFTA